MERIEMSDNPGQSGEGWRSHSCRLEQVAGYVIACFYPAFLACQFE